MDKTYSMNTSPSEMHRTITNLDSVSTKYGELNWSDLCYGVSNSINKYCTMIGEHNFLILR